MNPDSLGSLQTFERVLAVSWRLSASWLSCLFECASRAAHPAAARPPVRHADLATHAPCAISRFCTAQAPINRSRDRNATEKEKELGATRSA